MACSRAAMEFSGRFCAFQAPRWARTRVSDSPPQEVAKREREIRAQVAPIERLNRFLKFFMQMPIELKIVPGENYTISRENALGRTIFSVETLPKRSVTRISRLESGAAAVTLNIWAVWAVTKLEVGTAPTLSRRAS